MPSELHLKILDNMDNEVQAMEKDITAYETSKKPKGFFSKVKQKLFGN